MQDLKLSKQPMSVLRRKILQFRHANPEVMRLMTLIASMVNFAPVDRVNIEEVMEVVVDVQHNG